MSGHCPKGKHFHHKNTWKNLQIIFIYNDLKREITLTKNLLRKESLEQFFIYCYLENCDYCGSCHWRFMREKFFKNEISENISQKFHDRVTFIHFKFKGTS